MKGVRLLLSLGALITSISCDYKISLTTSSGLVISDGNNTIVNNSAILAGNQNTTATALKNSTQGLTYSFITPTIAKVTLNTSSSFLGARFSAASDARFFGVWEYPFNYQIDNSNITFDLKGVGNNVGINWVNARAPFFLTSAGYGVYSDTLKMGSYNFSVPGEAQFIFNSSSLSIIEQYTALSARSEMPPTSGLGPTFWSDDFTQDFHGSVSNAQENIQDVVNHLYYSQIRATGNRSWGNFDFDPNFYPNPRGFIKNLTDWGFDFQLRKKSEEGGLGEALNLSIPAAYDYFEKKLEYFASVGVKGYKIDRGEEGEMPDYVQNEQMALFLQLAYDSMVQKWGASNYFTFARSVVDRSRARTAVWNGDSHANFTGLAYTVASGIRAGLMSFPIWGSDTGGYTREGALTPTEEVWARWMWFSAFSPVYELMLGTNHTPWYAPYTQQTVDALKATSNLHADLTPYIKSYAYTASKTGIPIIRALFLEAATDAKTWDFLVAPIVSAGGKRSYFSKNSTYSAGATANVSVGLDSIPVYVTQGAIIPRGDIFQGNAKWIEDWQPFLRIELFPSFEVAESRFTAVEIVLKTDKEKGSAAVVWYLKEQQGGKEVNLNRGGGFTELKDVECLF
ncbi:glycoside hydrolase family 31 protein [Melanomma pulvis-pyrius CBS 109.77]|uniref:Glycoside hydrolase family 31 protein n=1 Tax=Melanomma pulvis-pyrius CBS 109.77 TaxID=1314802 RepID=A0A6A6X473_9PLEO|nr:glycoside hydrolase family 31 protein [Melanomma pulvis-pyrius CBS 109.77]